MTTSKQSMLPPSLLLLYLITSSADPSNQWKLSSNRNRLPQHRIRSPRRIVSYPRDHPLGLHLQTSSDDVHDSQYLDELQNDYIVGGEGWSGRRQRRRRYLQYVDDNLNQDKNIDHNLQSVQHEQVEKDCKNQYWTVTGRNLVNEQKDDTGEESTLLVDVSTLTEDLTEDKGNSSLFQGGAHAADNLDDADDIHDIVTDDESDRIISEGEHPSMNSETTHSIESSSKSSQQIDPTTPTSKYQPIRLRAILTDDPTSGSAYLTSRQRTILMEDMINPALYAWSKALHVVPVLGGLVVDKSQLFDGESCGPGLDSGLPSVKVPQEHMNITEGLTGTDTVIYISVSFKDHRVVSSSEIFTRSIPYLHGGESGPNYRGTPQTRDDVDMNTLTDLDAKNQTDVPSEIPSRAPTMTTSETEPFADTRPQCSGSYLASATHCSTDQYDRPVAGLLSICIENTQTFFSNSEIKRNIVTIMHEIGHILGFNAESMAHFRDGDTGEPLTPRDENGDVPDVTVECTGVQPRVKSNIALPSTNITVFKNVRGGVRVAMIATPTVKRVARNMFGCQSLNGAELESGEWQLFEGDSDEISAGECIGDHWERRLFRTDLLNPIVDDVSYSLFISSLTLAYFADSGWYKVDTRRIASASIWGRNAGCNFVNQKCVTRHGSIAASNNAFFCNNILTPEKDAVTIKSSTRKSLDNVEEESKQEIHGCNLDSSSKAVCSIVEYDFELPVEYSYFSSTKLLGGDLLGGNDPTLDYCPVFKGYSNGNCKSETSEQFVGVKKSLEVFGRSNSRCVIGNVDKKRTALCLPMACVIQDHTLMVKVDGYWKSCLYAGQIISVWWNRKDYVVCPDPSHLCPTFYCPNDCLQEAGVCDYRKGQCMCTPLAKMNGTSQSSWLSTYYSTPILEPCSGYHPNVKVNGSFHVTERIDVELPDYYVTNTTFLQDDPRDFDDKVSRMFAQLSSGEVVGLVASFMLFIMFSYIIWYQVVKCYRQRLLGNSLTRVKSSVNSLSGLLRNSSLASLNPLGTDNDEMDSPPTNNRPPPGNGRDAQKDKMVATLLVQNRIESTALAERIEQQARLELAGIGSNSISLEQTNAEGETSNQEQPALINRSELPHLPNGGRILAVIGAHIVEDNYGDARSSVTSATQVTSRSMVADNDSISEYTSPLYQDEGNEQQVDDQRYYHRLRHGSSSRHID